MLISSAMNSNFFFPFHSNRKCCRRRRLHRDIKHAVRRSCSRRCFIGDRQGNAASLPSNHGREIGNRRRLPAELFMRRPRRRVESTLRMIADCGFRRAAASPQTDISYRLASHDRRLEQVGASLICGPAGEASRYRYYLPMAMLVGCIRRKADRRFKVGND